jgi:hypothetical protein
MGDRSDLLTVDCRICMVDPNTQDFGGLLDDQKIWLLANHLAIFETNIFRSAAYMIECPFTQAIFYVYIEKYR